MPAPKIAFVLPCYNEQAIILDSVAKLSQLLGDYIREGLVHESSFLLFVDDGSRDKTVELLQGVQTSMIKILKLSANCGHQSALLAGMHFVTGKVDCMISMDTDLQDDINSTRQMILAYNNGSHIVYGVRQDRSSDTKFKKYSALLFYRLIRLLGVNVIYNHADFRLVSNKVLAEFSRYREVNFFLRGIFPKMGFPSSVVYYNRLERQAGETKYPFYKMLSLAVNGITSFSNMPLKFITWLGFFVFLGSVCASIWVVFTILTGRNVPGWASITLPVYFLGGVQLLAIGVLGEYVSKVYLETKQRPPYHIQEVIE